MPVLKLEELVWSSFTNIDSELGALQYKACKSYIEYLETSLFKIK